jgi:hypothetical protein
MPVQDCSNECLVLIRRFRDPADPSRLYLAQPVAQGDTLQQRPVYAPEYGKPEEPYESTGLRP